MFYEPLYEPETYLIGLSFGDIFKGQAVVVVAAAAAAAIYLVVIFGVGELMAGFCYVRVQG